MSAVSNIFSSEGEHSKKLSSERLQAYLEGKLSPDEQYEVELWLSEEGMENDAVEGLQALPVKDIRRSVRHLDRQLNKYLIARRRRYYKDNNWAWIAIIVILLCCVLAYTVIHYILKS